MVKRMSMLQFRLLIAGLLGTMLMEAHAESPDSIFARFFYQTEVFANTYPREKVHLHFDNTSYYLGDTIWFKSYVVTAEGNRPSAISKPLYVELLDQLGNVQEKQIIQLTNGEGHGQFVLNKTFLSGYYEVRAYTKWMIAFEDMPYFSRTFPIYRKRLQSEEAPRDIATYYMDESMKQRPKNKEKNLIMRFFPEGGQLVKGVKSVVAFEISGRNGKAKDVQGMLYSSEGDTLAELRTLHDGMGYFLYQPGEKAAKAEMVYEGRNYRFSLPEALPAGYTLAVDNRQDMLNVTVARSSTSLNDTLALFVTSQGRTYMYSMINFRSNLTSLIQLPANDLPGGVTQLSLVTSGGVTLCDRFCYVLPHVGVAIKAKTNNQIYSPFAPIHCQLKVTDHQDRPLKATCSVAIRDGVNSDYQEYDNSIYTDLLLTSDLKGYIHQPGFYFAEQSPGRRKLLDILLLVRGWRKYDMAQIIGKHHFSPLYSPEKKLTLYGQVKSILGKAQRNIGVNILARKDSVSIAGMTETDSLGYFSIPVDGFTGALEAFFQTRKKGKKMNTETRVSLFRNFAPNLRTLDHEELNPVWKEPTDVIQLLAKEDSLYKDSVFGDDHLLDEVVVKAKRFRHLLKQTQHFEKEILAYYDLPQVIDRMRDDGKYVHSLPLLLKELNKNFVLRTGEESLELKYNNVQVLFVVNGKVLSTLNTDFVLDKEVDAIKTLTLYSDQTDGRTIYMMNTKTNRVMKRIGEDFWTEQSDGMDLETLFNDDANNKSSATSGWGFKEKKSELKNKSAVVCSIITIDDWDPGKSYQSNRGIRYTHIQGYNKPLEFYSPAYPDGAPFYVEDYRRTLYWNPNVQTDEHGEVVVKCYNSGNSAPLTISVETLYDGCPAALDFHSVVNL